MRVVIALLVGVLAVVCAEEYKAEEANIVADDIPYAAAPSEDQKNDQTPPPSCDSHVYCQGDLLHTVQMAGIFNDSKHFVDMEMLYDEADVLQNFKTFMKEHNQQPNKDQLEAFVNENFIDANELQRWTPGDFKEEPAFLAKVQPEEVRTFAKNVVAIWPHLGRKINEDTLANISRHSLLPLTEGFIIPGGRFRETYYWDTYWIIRGLLISEMPSTVRGMLDNFVTLIQRFGYIPNGARVYYSQRSQPPLFAMMVREYFRATGDKEWLKRNLAYVEQEVNYWLRNRMQPLEIGSETVALARYYPVSLGPRPESYKEDYRTASLLPTDEAKQQLYTNLKGGAESGWDYSSRWFYDADGGGNANLTAIDMQRTIPVDLNSFLYGACRSLRELNAALGRAGGKRAWARKAAKLKKAIRVALFNEEDGMWYDYDMKLKRHRRDFSVSNVSPLWVHADHTGFQAGKFLAKLQADKVLEFVGGTPTTMKRTGEQWDLPNAWPPLQAIMVQALQNMNTKEGKEMAEHLAKQWVNANMIGYDRTGYMFEKYDAIEPGQYGGGGEYDVQSGFGWSNGVALEFISEYYTGKTQ